MSDSSSVREVIERLVKQAGITKKLAAEILHIIPEIIEDGLQQDGEVRVKGLGTFRLKWIKSRTGRNPKTGERVEIPAHNRLVFLPERSFKEYINRDYRLLSYKIIPGIEKTLPENHIIPDDQAKPHQEPEPQPEPDPVPDPKPEPEPEPEPEPLPAPEFFSESELPAPRRRIHWIIPSAVAVIIILSLVFYVRNCCHEEVDSPQLTVSSRQSAIDSQQLADSSQQLADSSQQPEIDNRQSTIDNRQSVPPSQHMISTEGKHLFKLAREVYGNPYLWVLIYSENRDKIADPDILISGRELVIPKLEGTPERLTRNDSLSVSEGYRLVYEYFKVKEDTRTDDFFKAMKRYGQK